MSYDRNRNSNPNGAPECWWWAYSIKEYGRRGQTKWTRIGRAFVNSDGSFNVEFDALPLGDRMQIRQETPEEAAEREQRKAERDSRNQDGGRR